MAAKSFKGGLDSLLGEGKKKGAQPPKKRGRPKTNLKTITKTSEIGTKAGETRATFIINEEQLETLKALAYWERLSIKDVLSQALTDYMEAKRKDIGKAMASYKSRPKTP